MHLQTQTLFNGIVYSFHRDKASVKVLQTTKHVWATLDALSALHVFASFPALRSRLASFSSFSVSYDLPINPGLQRPPNSRIIPGLGHPTNNVYERTRLTGCTRGGAANDRVDWHGCDGKAVREVSLEGGLEEVSPSFYFVVACCLVVLVCC